MQKRLTEFEVGGGASVIVQSLEPTGEKAGVEKIGRADDLAQKASSMRCGSRQLRTDRWPSTGQSQ